MSLIEVKNERKLATRCWTSAPSWEKFPIPAQAETMSLYVVHDSFCQCVRIVSPKKKQNIKKIYRCNKYSQYIPFLNSYVHRELTRNVVRIQQIVRTNNCELPIVQSIVSVSSSCQLNQVNTFISAEQLEIHLFSILPDR